MSDAPASLDEYRFICARAVAVRVLSDRYYPECFYRRNDFLVDNASVVVGYYDGQMACERSTPSNRCMV